MQQRILSIVFLMTAILLFVACEPNRVAPNLQETEATSIRQSAQNAWPDASQLKVTDSPTSCEEPATPNEPSCDMLERQILGSVVRYEIYGPSKDGSGRQAEGLGHGTVKDGRFLVVHNHFGVDLASFKSGSPDAVITMYNGFGDLFIWKSSPNITVAVEQPEALVLDFGQSDDGKGYFEKLGVPSALFNGWQEVAPQVGQIVAQVVWNGRRSDVDWTSIGDVILDDGTPRLVLANPLLPGASGGGVFLDGVHIAVNWERGMHLDQTGAVMELFSTAALNSSASAEIVSE
jgi:hypothetical protein